MFAKSDHVYHRGFLKALVHFRDSNVADMMEWTHKERATLREAYLDRMSDLYRLGRHKNIYEMQILNERMRQLDRAAKRVSDERVNNREINFTKD